MLTRSSSRFKSSFCYFSLWRANNSSFMEKTSFLRFSVTYNSLWSFCSSSFFSSFTLATSWFNLSLTPSSLAIILFRLSPSSSSILRTMLSPIDASLSSNDLIVYFISSIISFFSANYSTSPSKDILFLLSYLSWRRSFSSRVSSSFLTFSVSEWFLRVSSNIFLSESFVFLNLNNSSRNWDGYSLIEETIFASKVCLSIYCLIWASLASVSSVLKFLSIYFWLLEANGSINGPILDTLRSNIFLKATCILLSSIFWTTAIILSPLTAQPKALV